MKERAKRKGSYKIVRFIALILSVICAMASLVICASATDQPPTVTWDWTPPHLGLWQEGNVYHYSCAITTYHFLAPSNWNPPFYSVFYFTVSCPTPITPYFLTYNYKQFILGTNSTGTFSVVGVSQNGTLGWSVSGNLNSGGGVVLAPVAGTAQWVTNGYVCNILDNNTASYDPELFQESNYYTHTPFVMFSYPAPEQIQYRSSLPVPQWDTHNRYIVINDKLYWLSLYIDNLWVNPFTGSVSQSNDTLTGVVTGNASDPTDGDLYYNYNVSITYQDKEYYCAQYNGIDYSFEDMCCPALIYSSSGSRLTISFDQLSGIYSSLQDILVDYRIYCSSFDLISGEYIESVYSAQGQVGNSDININISCPDTIESIYCYGVEFQNPQNLPVNLGSVLWSYDLDFASWRSDISSKLDAIYALLSQSSIPSTTAPKDYCTAVSEVSDLPTYNASDVAGVLNSAVSDVNANLSSGIEWGQGWFARIYHDIPELFIVVVLALAFGLVLLVLGKKKSDS